MPDAIRQANDAVDQGRQAIEEVGLRVYRVFVLAETYTEQVPGSGSTSLVRYVELLPSPKLKFLPTTDQRRKRRVEIGKISRSYTADQLKGLEIDGVARSDEETISIGVNVRGSSQVERFTILDEPRLKPFEWRIEAEATGAFLDIPELAE